MRSKMEGEISDKLLSKATHNDNATLQEIDDAEATSNSTSSITPMLLLSTFVAVLGSLSCGFAIGYTSPVQYEIMKDLDLSTAEYSIFGSMNNIGGALGSILCGKITDYFGRKKALGLGAIFFILGWFAITVGQDIRLLDVGRFLLGFASAISSYAVPVYIAEFTPKNLRGGFTVLHVMMLGTGLSIVTLIGLITDWRTLALIGIIPSLFQMAGLLFIPESPRWLMMINKIEEFEESLQRFRGGTIDIYVEATDIKDSAKVFQHLSGVHIRQLLQMKYAYTLTVGFGLNILSMLIGISGILSYSYSIFESAGLSGKLGSIGLALFQLPSMALGIILLDKCGRRPLLMVSVVGICCGCLVTGLSFIFQDHNLLEGFSPYLALIGISIYIASYPLGVGGVTSVITAEIYPLNIKGVAGSATALVYSITAGLVSYTFNFSMEWSSSGTFFILACFCVVTLIFVAKLVPETRGRTLEEVHISMSKVWQ